MKFMDDACSKQLLQANETFVSYKGQFSAGTVRRRVTIVANDQQDGVGMSRG